MVKTYQCKYCAHLFLSIQGQRSHLAQAKRCHERWQADLDTVHIPPQDLFEGCSDDDHTPGIGEQPATDRDPDVDLNVDKPSFPELPGDEPLVIEEQGEECHHNKDDNDSTPLSKG